MNVPETSTALMKIEKVDQALPAPAITSVRPEASEFHNPYHFVPVKKGTRSNDLSRADFENRKTAHVTHDRYLDATFSGRLVCKLTTEGPCVFGSTQKPGGGGVTEVQNYTLDGVHAVPATSIKGLLSAVAEAASNSALDPVGLFLVHRTARYGHDELNTRRYHAGWVSEPPATWPERYELEKAASATGGPSPHDLRELFRTEMDADIRHALELLGDPNATMAPVQYPNTTAGESEAFRWWVANDRNPEPDVRQSLDPISPQTHSLPTLRRQ